MSEILPVLIEIIQHYGYLIVFLGAILGGDAIIIAAAFLAFQSYLSIYWVIILSLSGLVLSDNFWYFVGRRFDRFLSFLSKTFFNQKVNDKINYFKRHFTDKFIYFIFVSKFIYGVRIATLVLAGKQKIVYKKFFWYNLSSSAVWMIFPVFVGYLVSISWEYLDNYNIYLRWLVLLPIIILFVFRFIFSKFVNIYKDYESGN